MMVGQEGTVVWQGVCSWLAARGQKEKNLPLGTEVRGGLEIRLKNVPKTLLSFLNKLLHWQRLQKHIESV